MSSDTGDSTILAHRLFGRRQAGLGIMWRIAILAVATAQAIISAAAIANQPEVTIGIYGTGGVGGGHILAMPEVPVIMYSSHSDSSTE